MADHSDDGLRERAEPEPARRVSDGIRVLTVDPSAAFRQLLGKVIRETPGFVLAATAQHGAAALEKIERLKPDVVTLELEMPVLDGFETLKQIRVNRPDLPVVVFSTMCQKGAVATVDCLTLGANDYLAKPDEFADIATAETWLRQNLMSRLRQFFPMTADRDDDAFADESNPGTGLDDTVNFVSDPSDTQVSKASG
jgi:two-component system chemotaxis response regulator CheB